MEETIARLKDTREENRKKNNGRFLILAVICCGYFLVRSGLVIALATAYCIWIFWQIHGQSTQWNGTFRQIQTQFGEAFFKWIETYISAQEPVRAACGYLETADGFRNVNIFRCGDTLYTSELLFQKHFVCAANNEFWYLFDLKQGVSPERVDTDGNKIAPCPEDHQTFLRKKGMQWEDLNIVEGYIYNRFLKELLDGKLVGNIAMDDGIGSLRKEKIYFISFSEENVLYLSGQALAMLELRDLGVSENYEN